MWLVFNIYRCLRRLDGNATLLLILAGVGETSLTGLGTGNNTSLGDQGVSQGGLAVIHVSDDGHVADVTLLVHQATDFVDGEVDL